MNHSLLPKAIAFAFIWIHAILNESTSRADDGTVKIFVLAGQSNMVGQAVVDLTGKDYNEGRGTLLSLWNDPAKRPQFAHLRNDDGTWRFRNDAFARYQLEDGRLLKGPLGIGSQPMVALITLGPNCSLVM